MNKKRYDVIKLIEQSDVKKAMFLENVLLSASRSYDYAHNCDADSVGGELALYFKRDNMMCRGGEMWSPVHCSFKTPVSEN